MLNTAARAARIAGKIILRNFEQADLDVAEKQKNDLVTNIDKECEKAIFDFIGSKYPGHRFLGEEGGAQETRQAPETEAAKTRKPGLGKASGDHLWIVDPIDGTTNFVKGIPHVAVSIALQINGVTELGVVYDPIRDEMFQALRGQGAVLNNRRLRVTDAMGLDGTILATAFPHRKRELMDSYTAILMRVFKECADIRRAGTASLDLAYVAAGRLDGYFELGLKPWDMAAGELMVREAGGIVADFKGGNDYMKSGSVLCGNPKIAKRLVALAREDSANL
ncbi:MAG: inositol monophosphatase [Succinivibrionaceae bacterium]|nr:inositol monophosphatase [Succinivibrionaceae bacterium]